MEFITEEDDQKVTPEYIAPFGAIEMTIAGVWEDVLDVEHVGRFDNFFSLGGDSLEATAAIAHLQDLFQIKVTNRQLGELLQNPTIAATAQKIEAIGEANQVDVSAIAGIINQIASLPEDEARSKVTEKEGQTK